MLGRDFSNKKFAQLVISVRSTFQNDLHPPIGGPHPLLYFTTQTTKKYCTAMCYLAANPFQLLKCLFPDLSFFCCDCNLGIVIWEENFKLCHRKKCWKQTYCLIKWQFFSMCAVSKILPLFMALTDDWSFHEIMVIDLCIFLRLYNVIEWAVVIL